MEINIQKLEEWYKQISMYEKLDINRAKKLLFAINRETDIEKKKHMRDQLIKGTLYVVYNFIKDNCIYLNSSAYDTDDIINTSNLVWINILDNNILFEYKNFSTMCKKFYEELTDELIDSRYSIFDNTNLDENIFVELLYEFFKLRNRYEDFNYNRFINFIANDKRFNELLYPIFNSAKLDNIYVLFDSIYRSCKTNEEDINLLKTRLDVIKYLLINNALEDLHVNIDNVIVTDLIDSVIERIYQKTILNNIFEWKNFTDKEKDIIKKRFGIKGYNEHSLEEIGLIYGTSRQNMHEIINKILKDIRVNYQLKMTLEKLLIKSKKKNNYYK